MLVYLRNGMLVARRQCNMLVYLRNGMLVARRQCNMLVYLRNGMSVARRHCNMLVYLRNGMSVARRHCNMLVYLRNGMSVARRQCNMLVHLRNGMLVARRQCNMLVYLRNGSAQAVVRACNAETEFADKIFCLAHSRYIDTGPTGLRTDSITSVAWHGSHWSTGVTGLTQPKTTTTNHAESGNQTKVRRSRG